MNTRERELTAQDIWELFRETDRMFRETEHRFEETDRMFRETRQEFRETQQELRRQSQETDRMFEETNRILRELTENVDKIYEQVNDLTGKWGEFVESMVEPAVIRLFAERDITIEDTRLNAERRRDGQNMEIDILGVNREYVVAVEVKTTLRSGDVKRHVRRLKAFREFFPEYREHKVIGAVAGMRLQEGVDKYAEQRGLYVLAQSGETVRVLNDESFEATLW